MIQLEQTILLIDEQIAIINPNYHKWSKLNFYCFLWAIIY